MAGTSPSLVQPSPTILRLGRLEDAFRQAVERLRRDSAVERMWRADHTLWKPEPREIADRLGWLACPAAMAAEVPRLESFAARCRSERLTRVLLLGMGGSSLAPEVLAATFGRGPEGLSLSVLDSTDPAVVRRAADAHPPGDTLHLVSTKSGTTPETLSCFLYLYNRAAASLGAAEAGRRFAAITDPGSALERTASSLGFRQTFLNDPRIGGRYSALSLFGLVPAALLGVDLRLLLERAAAMAAACGPSAEPRDNPGLALGAALGACALSGADKLTLVSPPSLSSFGAWLEQLIAESTGKEGKGILPVDGEPLGPPASYGPDRLFVGIVLGRGGDRDGGLDRLEAEGRPVVRIALRDRYDLGGEFFRWEVATALAGAVLGINPFDQPDVESAKVQARAFLDAFRRDGRRPSLEPDLREGSLAAVPDTPSQSLAEAVRRFLGRGEAGAYVAVQAFVDPTGGTLDALDALRQAVRDRTGLAVTVGIGPRFLHSTGQLHKGDGGAGLFLQLVSADAQDEPIPDEAGRGGSSMTFGTLKAAQALGDRQALLAAGRRVFTVLLQGDPAVAIRRLASLAGG